MSKTHNTPAYDTNGVRVAPLSEREAFMADSANGVTFAERYRAWQARPNKGGHYRWPTYNEVQDALHAAEEADLYKL